MCRIFHWVHTFFSFIHNSECFTHNPFSEYVFTVSPELKKKNFSNVYRRFLVYFILFLLCELPPSRTGLLAKPKILLITGESRGGILEMTKYHHISLNIKIFKRLSSFLFFCFFCTPVIFVNSF